MSQLDGGEHGTARLVKAGGGWSSIIAPFCNYIAEPHTGGEEKLVKGEIDFAQLGAVKVWIDAAGHYQRPEILQFGFDARPHWADEKIDRFGARSEQPKAKEEAIEQV